MLLLGMSGHGRSLSLGLRPGCGMPWCGMPQRGLTGTRTGSPGSGRATGMTFSSRTFWELVESPQQAGSGGLSIWDAARFSRPLLPGGWRGCCVNRGLTAPWWVAGVLREQGSHWWVVAAAYTRISLLPASAGPAVLLFHPFLLRPHPPLLQRRGESGGYASLGACLVLTAGEIQDPAPTWALFSLWHREPEAAESTGM